MLPINLTDVVARIEHLGGEVPADLRAQAELVAKLQELQRPPSTDGLEEQLRTGAVTASTVEKIVRDAAQRLLVDREIQSLVNDFRRAGGPIEKGSKLALRRAGDVIIEALRPAFDQAAAELVASIAELGPDPDRRAVLKVPTAAELWHKRKAVLDRLQDVRAVRVALAAAGYPAPGGPMSPRASWYTRGIRDEEALALADSWFKQGGFPGLAAGGFELFLSLGAEAAALEKQAVDASKLAASEAARLVKVDPRAAKTADAWQRMAKGFR